MKIIIEDKQIDSEMQLQDDHVYLLIFKDDESKKLLFVDGVNQSYQLITLDGMIVKLCKDEIYKHYKVIRDITNKVTITVKE